MFFLRILLAIATLQLKNHCTLAERLSTLYLQKDIHNEKTSQQPTEKTMNIVKPAALKRGDTIGVVAPASAPTAQEKIDNGAAYLERLGYRVKLGKNVRAVRGFLAGTDEQRASDINDMFADNDVKAIIAVRGGYGTPRILPLLDYDLIKRNPKILVGYSDLTALQLALFHKTGLVSFSGPMAGVEMWKEIDPFTEEHFWRTITSTAPMGAIKNPDGKIFKTFNAGTAEGILLGGNLSLVASITGTPFLPSFKNSLLFLEEVEEECYRFDRMLAQLKLAGILNDASGIILGELTDVKASDTAKPFLTADEVVADYFSPLNIPILTGLVYGHIPRKLTMPIGIRARMSADEGKIELIEAGVK
ncbi:MAG: LD-carboxypeptidase [Bacteroidota bacterium]|nr:LD-carboxypeptidase [Bacteroidota bacterium]